MGLLDADFNITLLNMFIEVKDNTKNFRWEMETKKFKRKYCTEKYINWNQELNEGLSFNEAEQKKELENWKID